MDLETTGLFPGGHDRVVEIAIVMVDAGGTVVGEWSTLVNPGRDVGPTSLHGIRARDLAEAPSFAEVAGTVADLFAGRVPAAHNLPFDLRFLATEYATLGFPQVPLSTDHGVCTMRLAPRYLPYAPRALAECCTVAGWELDDAHAALPDARAAARLLIRYLELADGDEPWLELLDEAAAWAWPPIPVPADGHAALTRRKAGAAREARAAAGAGPDHFLARLLPAMPRVPDPPMADPYLAVLDDVVADRWVDPAEASALVALAGDLGLDRGVVEGLHRGYLTSLARAAWEDGVVTEYERRDLDDVALLFGLPAAAVEQALDAGRTFTGGAATPSGTLRLERGDGICFTGQMSRPREELEVIAEAAGLRVTGSVSGKTAMLVCADAHSMSGKAKKARAAGTTVVSEPKFHQLLADLTTA